MVDHIRDRDPTGRPHNARPRDELGRPLPHGAPGVAPVPDELVLSRVELLEYAQDLLDQHRPFQAHEVLEAGWKAAPEPERELWRGLAQLAVGLTHARRGNATGAVELLRRSADRLRAHPAPPYGIDGPALVAWTLTLLETIEHDGVAGLSPDRLVPRLRRTEKPDG